MNRTINTTATSHCAIRGVDYRVDSLRSDVPWNGSDNQHQVSIAYAHGSPLFHGNTDELCCRAGPSQRESLAVSTEPGADGTGGAGSSRGHHVQRTCKSLA